MVRKLEQSTGVDIAALLNKIERIAAGLNGFPHITSNGKWQTTVDGYWTGGFWLGLLWLGYQLSHEEKYLKWAYRWLNLLEGRKGDKTTFDLGFLFYPSFVLGYQITEDESLRRTALEAADTLSQLFHQKANFIHHQFSLAGKTAGRTIIDVMMNLPLLWWAYEETGNEKYYEAAYQHSRNSLREFIRDDYSTIHVIDFDLETGETIQKITVQGHSDDSCWSRGQAWAIYGFALAYKTSQDKRFLETAEKLANYFIENLPDDRVPYWDFSAPEMPNSVRDSSAAAIAGSGLFTLSELSRKQCFREAAINILDSLGANYLAGDSEGILRHGCYHKPENLGVDESLIFGDYYFVEAMTKP